MNTPAKYSKTERDTLNTLIKEKQITTQAYVAKSFFVFASIFPIAGILTYVHIYSGPYIVLVILAISAVIGVGFLFAFMNDKSQERASNHSILMTERLAKGINEAVSQNAKTQGDQERGQFKIWVNEQLQQQRQIASQNINEQKKQLALPVYNDDNEVSAPYDRYEEAY